MSLPFRIGLGYDIHRFAPGRRLVLGGVEIPHDKGLDGHSDADCLTHALADAVLGALGLADIGHFFPNDDPSCKDMDSQDILRRAVEEAHNRGYAVGNVDIALIAEEPKIAPYLTEMKAALAQSLRIEPTEVGLKATTNEKIGDLGRCAGIAAHAVCMLIKKD
ncbi:2-C-methyl-D-erythritol 2,4-cyclodiphosphate synthase [Cerasicoccus maritimus]|uniref:2-C-methyl-D-erythritol 2,4-cyclodiphosphate synthase n=1 Tax=Cerasicoccus maritimus TaxID=490089 RepID=UPI002852A2DF|nr:2-C-methyl-D-erythritol 2,4-cyclodiphosphate synthase [Cerasicoccus maritimus]